MQPRFIECACNILLPDKVDNGTPHFSEVRDGCPALREILIPSTIWKQYRQSIEEPLDRAHHRPILFLAFKRGYLSRLTNPLHRFILDRPDGLSSLQAQYRADLQETWMSKSTPIERHRRAKIFRGKLAELRVAQYLEQRGYRILTLEALGASHDIELGDDEATRRAVEVKYIGQDEVEFEMVVDALAHGVSGRSISPQVACNYLVFRIFEAANQLYQFIGSRVAYIVLSEDAWGRVKIPLHNRWIDWSAPTFFVGYPDWDTFLACKKGEARFADIEQELSSRIHQLHEVCILHESTDFQFHEICSIRF